MNKEEILAKSRIENKQIDERELQIRLKASRIAKAFGIAIAFLLVLVEGVWFDMPIIGWTALTIAFGMNAIEDWIVVFGVKKKSEWATVVFDTAFLIAAVVMLIKEML